MVTLAVKRIKEAISYAIPYCRATDDGTLVHINLLCCVSLTSVNNIRKIIIIKGEQLEAPSTRHQSHTKANVHVLF